MLVRDLFIRSRDGHAIVDGISFEVPEERNLFLVGESGSGKTSLLAALAAVSPHEVSGEISLGPTPGAPLLAVQDAAQAFTPYFRLGCQVADGLTDRNLGGELLDPLLADLGLSAEVLHRYPHELSGGMLKRVLVAALLAHEDRLLLFDEPTAGIDPSTRWAMMEAMGRRARRFAVATHDLSLVSRSDGYLLVMLAGRGVEFGPVARVLGDPRHEYTRRLLEKVGA